MEATTQPATRPTAGRPLAANLPVWVLVGAFLGVLVGSRSGRALPSCTPWASSIR